MVKSFMLGLVSLVLVCGSAFATDHQRVQRVQKIVVQPQRVERVIVQEVNPYYQVERIVEVPAYQKQRILVQQQVVSPYVQQQIVVQKQQVRVQKSVQKSRSGGLFNRLFNR